jgi:hypothetical protein
MKELWLIRFASFIGSRNNENNCFSLRFLVFVLIDVSGYSPSSLKNLVHSCFTKLNYFAFTLVGDDADFLRCFQKSICFYQPSESKIYSKRKLHNFFRVNENL